MGKRQHQSDKLYVTGNEWSKYYGGHKKTKKNSDFRRLPYYCCSISLQPIEKAYISREGHVFDESNILPWLMKYKTNPITGKKLKLAELVKLKFHKNGDGKYHCPVLFKTFNENSSIVCIATTGNVFSQEAIDQLNVKTKNWKDLITDVKFTRQDIITVQDPTNLDKFNLQKFHHLKHNLKLPDADLLAKKDPKYYMKSINAETSQTLRELKKEYKGDKILRDVAGSSKQKVVKVDKYNKTNHTTGMVAASFTSTVQTPRTKSEVAARDNDEVRYSYVKKKGYVSLTTNFGKLNVELHCDIVPKTCENFIGLCKKGYYNGTKFHRLIKNFMVQGGDPTGTGTGGESLWGTPFKDEFAFNLQHGERGVLSMANSGTNTNKSQFFVTFRSCPHLNRKHTVFGKIVGGMKNLNEIEQVETDRKTDRPKKDVTIEECQVFVDPFQEADDELAKLREEDRMREAGQKKTQARKSEDEERKVYRSGVGKYVGIEEKKAKDQDDDLHAVNSYLESLGKKKVKKSGFSNW